MPGAPEPVVGIDPVDVSLAVGDDDAGEESVSVGVELGFGAVGSGASPVGVASAIGVANASETGLALDAALAADAAATTTAHTVAATRHPRPTTSIRRPPNSSPAAGCRSSALRLVCEDDIVPRKEHLPASRLKPYISFPGNAREAMEFYKDVFGGNSTVNTFGEYGDQGSADADKIMHGQLETDSGFTLMGADTPAGMQYNPGDNIAVSLSGDDADELRGYWQKLSDGGTVTMPLKKQMWSDEFGMCLDRFGVSWMVQHRSAGLNHRCCPPGQGFPRRSLPAVCPLLGVQSRHSFDELVRNGLVERELQGSLAGPVRGELLIESLIRFGNRIDGYVGSPSREVHQYLPSSLNVGI
jgi:PhnB protein